MPIRSFDDCLLRTIATDHDCYGLLLMLVGSGGGQNLIVFRQHFTQGTVGCVRIRLDVDPGTEETRAAPWQVTAGMLKVVVGPSAPGHDLDGLG